MESLKDDIAALKSHASSSSNSGFKRGHKDPADDGEYSWRNNRPYRPYNKIDFPVFSDGDPRVGDVVFLKIQPYRQKSLAKRRYDRLSPRFFGPYKVTRKVGPVAYELELPPDARVHPVFHVSMLKPARGQVPTSPIAPLPITKDWKFDVQPKEVLSHRWVWEAGQHVLELLISWCQRPVEEATWECYDLLRAQFPSFRLEDKSFYRAGSSDKPPIRLVYSRRKKKMAKGGPAEVEQLKMLMGISNNPLSG
ncbi:unnamed protein product [Cuscuta campestris]|uniref:Tf2-1-like SH3-like domain-containing protein n=1 Tax=Cuscuta campestris TaxID=132261 RepID=A0A484KQI4_9ASTE|nr:unnamed protein product [Cuscuta campestris]